MHTKAWELWAGYHTSDIANADKKSALPEVVVVEGALQKVVEVVEEEAVVVVAQASVRFLASLSYEKYSQSLCPWREGREEKENWKKKKKGRRGTNVFMHCKLKISQISSSQQTEDFCSAPLPKLQ